ncbi:MAG: hypothetical protein A2284_01770 [Deltaproteobacteria bacterium RIFOXYA12_FULL_61_11]|nr:MAG: hypothetical protein A2284_01770 [Deltaproteobacteria bacterium RIFOXYA12_FULL_61_11]
MLSRYIREDLLPGFPALDENLSLFEAGVLDSLALIKVLLFVERRFGVRLGMKDLSLASFDTIAQIAALVEAQGKDR